MDSLTKLYKYGHGPSSSHTMGPYIAAKEFLTKYQDSDFFEVDLFGSLALTGKGHCTDKILEKAFTEFNIPLEKTKISFIFPIFQDGVLKETQESNFLDYHSNRMLFRSHENGKINEWEVFSVGGGTIYAPTKEEKEEGPYTPKCEEPVYGDSKMAYILERCEERGIPFWKYVYENEANYFLKKDLRTYDDGNWGHEESLDFWEYQVELFFIDVWKKMEEGILAGLNENLTNFLPELNENDLPGDFPEICDQRMEVRKKLKVKRRASEFYRKSDILTGALKRTCELSAYACATMEHNATMGQLITAPTFGSAGVLPAVLYYLKKSYDLSDGRLAKALATAGLFGNLIKQNATISGASGACQAEIGTACAMTAAAAAQILSGSNYIVENAAEIGLEHNLGLTCTPLKGLVQVPCIERNAICAVKSLDSANYAFLGDGKHSVSFDDVVQEMKETGERMDCKYKETRGLTYQSLLTGEVC